ncbi:MAG: hypothetical protein LBD11_03700 [Candidatus Peribacteria bacterium]|nr:hypothetical protein [Candidatus Peribacteria bacterium]
MPPKENGGHEWIQMEIESIDTSSDPSNPTFTVEVHGVEQPQGDGWE